MIAVIFIVPLLVPFSLPMGELHQQERSDEVRIKQLLAECLQKRKATGSFRMEFDIVQNDKVFHDRSTSRARFVGDGAELWRFDSNANDPKNDFTYARSGAELYIFWHGAGTVYAYPSATNIDIHPKKGEGIGSWFVRGVASSMAEPILMLDLLSAEPKGQFIVHLKREDQDLAYLEITRPHFPDLPTWINESNGSLSAAATVDRFQVTVDKKTGFAASVKVSEPCGNENLYLVRSLERGLTQRITKEDLLKGLSLNKITRVGPEPKSSRK